MFRSLLAACLAVFASVTLAFGQETQIDDMVQGAEDAPVTIIEYASYTCPHCASFHAGPYKDLKKDYIDTGKVKFIFREVYFDRFGLWASMIARCAGPDRYFGVADLLFSSQSTWARAGDPNEIIEALRKTGRMAGMTDADLDACLQDADQAQALVSWYQKNAEADSIRSTPSLIINGEQHANMNYADLKEIIDGLLAE